MTLLSRLLSAAALTTLTLTATVAFDAGTAVAKEEKKKKSKPVKMQPAFQKPLMEAQKLTAKQDYAGALEQLRIAQAAAPTRSPGEEFYLQEALVQIYFAQKDYPNLIKALEGSLATGQMEPEGVAGRQKVLGQLSLQSKDWAKAAKYLSEYTAATPTDLEARYQLAQSYYFGKDAANTRATVNSLVASARAAGQPVQETWLQLPLRLAVDAQDRPGAINALADIVAVKPTPAYWRDLLNQVQAQRLSDRANLSLIRLKDMAAEMEANDYLEVAEVALRLGLPGEARGFMQKAQAASLFRGDQKKYADDILKQASDQALADEKALPANEKSAAAAKLGLGDVVTGAAYLGYGNNAKAAEMIARGIGKGGVKDVDDAWVTLGIAKVRLGDLEGAKTAFASATGNPQMAQIARMWSLYVQTKQMPAPAPAAAPAAAPEQKK